MTKRDNHAAEPLLLDFKQICAMLNISHQHFYALRDTGRFPIKPIRLGRSVRYRRAEVEAWIASGCRADWRPTK